MVLTKMDQKWRVQIPKKIRKRLGLKSRQIFSVDVERGEIVLKKPAKASPRTDPLLRDIIERPFHKKGLVVTRDMINRIKEET